MAEYLNPTYRNPGMLIIPAERQVDWRHPPLATLAIILINILIFFVYQGRDEALMDEAFHRYQHEELVWLEAPAYAHWLQREANLHDRDTLARAQEVRAAIADRDETWLSWVMLSDLAFYKMLLKDGGLYWQRSDLEHWMQVRPALTEDLVLHISSFESGLLPADIHLSDLFAYQFLHGGIGHLTGNMVFLFLLGFTLERALGRSRYVMSYLACGALSGLFFSLFEGDSWVPLVGASGAISGLMGMYVALFGLKKIRFFYFVGVYFNYFTAPALVMLPVWIGKELYDFWLGEASGVAYLAHAGGLMAGAGLMWLFGKSWLQATDTFFEPSEEDQDQLFRARYAKALNAISRFEFEQAKGLFAALWRDFPKQIGLLDHLYQLHKLDPSQAPFHACAKELLSVGLKRDDFALALSTYQDYLKRTGELSELGAEDHFRMMFAALRHNDLKEAEAMFSRVQPLASEEMLREAAAVMAQEFKRRQMEVKAQKYQALTR